MARHIISPERSTLHGKFSADLTPAASVDLGDTLEFRNVLDVVWGRGQHDRVQQTRDKWGPRERPGDDGIALHGPVYLRALQPGDTLSIAIEEVRVGDYGWTWAGATAFTATLFEGLKMGPELNTLLLWELDADTGWATSEKGHRAEIRPFPGTIGLCPGSPGPHESWFPTRTGGNMDSSQVRAGSTLYLPVEVPGGLLSLGDGHAAQGDGELSGSAIECMLERLVLRVDRATDIAVNGPTVSHPDGRWATMGFGESLDDALHMAGANMLDVMMQVLGCAREEALLLSSTFVDLGFTQVVNGVRGVHAVFRPPEMTQRSAASRA